jgi:predicted dehydrogenase
MKDIKNAVIIGFGGMGQQHRHLLEPINNINLIGTYDIESEKMIKGSQYGLKAYESYKDVLEDVNIDLLIIATPNHLHKNIVISGLEAGKHVVCEKPVTLNSNELQEILDVCEVSEGEFFIHQNRRWDEDYLVVKQVADQKMIGDIFHIETKVHGSRGVPGDWRKEKEYGGGMMLDWGVHLIDRLMCLVNEPVKSLFCKLSHIRTNDVDDGFILHLTFDSGITAVVEVGTFNYIQMPLWYVLGSQGAMEIDDWSMAGRMHRFNENNEMDAKPIVAGAGLTKTMAYRDESTLTISEIPRVTVDNNEFYNNVYETMMGNMTQIIKNSEVMYVMKLMEAAMESSRLNQVIYL